MNVKLVFIKKKLYIKCFKIFKRDCFYHILLLLSTTKPKGKGSSKLLRSILAIQAKLISDALLLDYLFEHLNLSMKLPMPSSIPLLPQRMDDALHSIPETEPFLHCHIIYFLRQSS